MEKELKHIEELKKLVSALLVSQRRFIKLSEKRSSMSYQDNTPKSIENAEASLNWHAMEHDKLLREVHAVSVNCGISTPKDDYSEVEYNPSAWHKYRHKPRVPECRKA